MSIYKRIERRKKVEQTKQARTRLDIIHNKHWEMLQAFLNFGLYPTFFLWYIFFTQVLLAKRSNRMVQNEMD